MRETRSMLLDGKSELTFAFKQFYSAQYAFFERLKIICGHGHLGWVFCECGHQNLITQKKDCVLKKSIDRKFGGSRGKKGVRYLRVFLPFREVVHSIMCCARQRECLGALPSTQRLQCRNDSL